MQNAILYLRVSTDAQVKSGAGLNAQRDDAHRWAESNDAEILEVCSDEDVSGSVPLDRRPGLMRAIQLLQKDWLLLVTKRDRAFRADKLTIGMIEYAVQKRGARIRSVAGEGTESDDPDDPYSELMRNMVDAFGNFERLMIGLRTKTALRAKRERREVYGPIPYGSVTEPGPDGREMLVDDPEQQVIISRIRNWKTEGVSLREIAQRLNDDDVPTPTASRAPMLDFIGRRSGKGWSHSTIASILRTQAVLNGTP